jgi:glycosyltransferase involved in cell wall biosynthesis
MVYLEAQACGVPVVAYENGGIAGVVEQRKTGFLTELHNDAAFDGAIGTLLQDKTLREKMGRAALEHVRHNHDLQHNYLQIEQALQKLVVGFKKGNGRVTT